MNLNSPTANDGGFIYKHMFIVFHFADQASIKAFASALRIDFTDSEPLSAIDLLFRCFRKSCSLFTDFENYSIVKPAPHQEAAANTMFDQVVAWSGALKTLR